MGVILGEVVGHPRGAAVNLGPAELLGIDLLTRRRPHQRGAAEEDGPLAADDDAFVGHGRHVGSAGGAGTHHQGDLRDAESGHPGLIVEDAAEVIAVGKDFVLLRQIGAPRVDEVDAGKPVFQSDFLGAQVLLYGDRIVGTCLDGGVVGDDQTLQPMNAAYAGD